MSLSEMVFNAKTIEEIKAAFDSQEYKECGGIEVFLAGSALTLRFLNLKLNNIESRLEALEKKQESKECFK